MAYKLNTIVLSIKFWANMFSYSNTMVTFAQNIYLSWFSNNVKFIYLLTQDKVTYIKDNISVQKHTLSER